MSRIAYVNGRYLPHREAAVHVEDRGYQFADGVYEVVCLQRGRFVDEALHLARLQRSLGELRIASPMAAPALGQVLREVARRNRLRDGLVYLQVTRGVAPRDHAFPSPDVPPSLVVTARRTPPFPADLDRWAGAAVTCPDIRWGRCDIKSVGLLPNVLAKQAARESGAVEAIMVGRDGMVTEGASTNVWVVDAAGRLRTRRLGNEILPGCTRAALFGLLAVEGIVVEERAVDAAELAGAREIFLTSATSFVRPITKLDNAPVGDGAVGAVTGRLFALMRRHVAGDMHNAG